jgi:hypothetical protein
MSAAFLQSHHCSAIGNTKAEIFDATMRTTSRFCWAAATIIDAAKCAAAAAETAAMGWETGEHIEVVSHMAYCR